MDEGHLLATPSPTGTFTELQVEINNTIANHPDGSGVLDLNKNYTYVDDDKAAIGNHIVINGKITINGNGAVLDADNKAGIFLVNHTDVVLNNITFINAKAKDSDVRAVFVTDNAANCTINNSYFRDNYVDVLDYPGGAVYWNGTNGTVSNTVFENNMVTLGFDGDDATSRGGAIFWAADNGTVEYCTFKRNYARNGGAISWGRTDSSGRYEIIPENGLIYRCNFTDNSVWYHGMAVSTASPNFSILQSNFTNNTGVYSAVMIEYTAENANVSHCIFKDNNASCHDFFEEGSFCGSAALETNAPNVIVEYCDFINNTAFDGEYYLHPVEFVQIDGRNSINVVDIPEKDVCYLDSTGSHVISHESIYETIGYYITVDRVDGVDEYFVFYPNVIAVSFDKQHTTSYVGAAKVGDSGIYTVFDNCYFFNNSANLYGAVEVDADNVIIRYSNFTNNTANAGQAGAVQWSGYNATILNCTFTNNNATADAGAIYFVGSEYDNWDDIVVEHSKDSRVINSTFLNNVANDGGAIYWSSYKGTVLNSSFTENTARNNGGAIYFVGTGEEQGFTLRHSMDSRVVNSTFFNNYATEDGGAIMWRGDDGSVSYSNFTDNHADVDGGAIMWRGDDGSVSYSNFTDNHANNGGAIFWHEDAMNGNVSYSNFTGNTADSDGGAIMWRGDDGSVSYSNFTGNTVEDGDGGAISWNGVNGVVSYSNFNANIVAYWSGGAIIWKGDNGNVSYSNFTDNYADDCGGAIFWHEDGANGSVSYSNFNANTAGYNGGAIYWKGDNGNVSYSNFDDNAALDSYDDDGGYGGAIYWEEFIDLWYNEDDKVDHFEYHGNGKISDSTFNNNSATNRGGAIYWNGNDGKISKSSFIDNNATEFGGAICWDGHTEIHGDGAPEDILDEIDNFCSELHGEVSQSNFTNNSADNAGAVYWYGDSGNITKSNFTDNHAIGDGIYTGNAGAINWAGEDGYISECIFIDNNATSKGGAIYWGFLDEEQPDPSQGMSGTIMKSNFTNNSATEEGGAIFWYSDEGNISDNCYFITNNATEGGAVYWYGPSGNINDHCYFISNSAIGYSYETSDGGWYVYGNGGAVYWGGESGNISDNCYFISNTADNGGAIYINGDDLAIDEANFTNNSAAKNGGAIYIKGESSSITHANFTGNTAEYGGAIYTEGNYLTIDVAYFNNNNATSGSAIYKKEGATDYRISNVIFDRNQANSEGYINVEVTDGDKSFAKADVTFEVTFKGKDNIANAIWDNDDESMILFKNITFDFSEDSKGRELQSFNEEWGTPTDGFEDESSIWQDPCEDAQLVDIIVKDQNGAVILNITNGENVTQNTRGLLSAKRYDEAEDMIVTDVDGKIRIPLHGLSAGTYTIEAVHDEDAYYTRADGQGSFVINEITKTTEDVLVMINQTVTYNITITNNGGEAIESINITDDYPEELDLLSYQTKWFGADPHDDWKWERYDGTNRFHITNGNSDMSSFIPEGETVVLILVFKAIEKGTFSNTAKVESYSTLPVVVTSQKTTVADVVLNVTKTANVTVTANNTLVNYTIVVNNTGLIDVTGVNIVDVLPGNLTYAGVWGNVTTNGAKITEISALNWEVSNITAGSHVSIWFTATVNTAEAGIITNVVNVNCSENDTVVSDEANVTVEPVVLNVTKVVNGATVVANNTLVNYTITVSNIGKFNATLVNITDVLPGNLTYAGVWGNVTINGATIREVSNHVWEVSNITADNYVSIWFTATVNTAEAGIITNVVNVNCRENKTKVSDEANVTVVPVILNVTKTANVTVVANNTLVNYTIVVKNIGDGNATLVNVTDVLPGNLTYTGKWGIIDANGAGVTNTTLANGVEWIISNITAGKSVSLWIEVLTNGVGNATNNVTVYSKENKTEVKDNETVDVLPVALKVTKTANVTIVANNTLVNYTITVSSIAKGNATLVKIADDLPDNLTYADKWGIIVDNGATIDEISPLTWEVSNIAAGNSVSIWFTVTVNATVAGNITNVVKVKCNENDTEVSAEANITVVPVVLNVTKTANVTVTANDTLVNYTIVVENIGSGNATLVNVTDLLPVGLVYFDWGIIDANGAGVTNTTLANGVEWIISNITAAKSVSLWIVAQTVGFGNLTNNVTVYSSENKTPVKDNETVEVGPVILNVTKVVNGATVVTNNTRVNYTITVSNVGRVNATLVNIADLLPNDLTYTHEWDIIEANGASIREDSDLKWLVSNIAAGNHLSIWFTVDVTAHKVGNITNVVKVNCSENDTEVSDKANITVLPNITKHVVGDLQYDVHDVVKYSIFIDVTKAGLSELVVYDNFDDWAFVVTDSIPGEWEYDETEHAFRYLLSDIPDTLTLEFTVNVTKPGKHTNFASIQIGDLPEVTAESEEIQVYAPDVNITKTVVDPRTVNLGDQVAFIINVTNTGDRSLDAGEVIVLEEFPGLSADYIEDIRGEWRAVDSVSLPYYALETTLAMGDYACFKIYFTTKSVGKIYNYATLHRFDKQDSDYVEVLPIITKHVDKSEINVGGSVEYSIFIDVTGATGLSELAIKDILNESFVLDESSISENWEYDEANNEFRYMLGDIPATLTLSFKVNITKAGNYTNVASLEINDLPEVTAESEVTRVSEVILNVTKVVNGDTVVANNAVVNYTINVSNIGDGNTTVVNVTDLLPAGLVYSDWGIINANGASVTNTTLVNGVEWIISNIAAGKSVSLWIEVRAVGFGNLTNNVVVYSSENKTQVKDNVTVEVDSVDLQIKKEVNVTNNTVYYNDTIKFTVTVTNNGPADATYVNVTEDLDSHLELVSWDGDGYYDVDEGLWYIGDVAKDDEAQLEIVARVIKLGNITNVVTIISYQNDTNKSNNNASVNFTAERIPTQTTVSNVSAYPDTIVNITVNVTAKDEKPINGNVTVILPDGNTTIVIIINGTGNTTWHVPADYVPGNYSVPAKFEGNETYLPSESAGNIEILPIPTNVTVSNVTTYPDTDVVIPINVTADDNKTISGNVTITFPDGSNQTVEIINGTGNATWHVPANYTPGNYTDFAVFDGNETYLQSNGTGNIEVLPIPTHTTVENVTGIAGQNVTIPVNVTADDDKPFNGNVTITFPDGSNQTVEIVNGTGNATWTIPEDYGGVYNDTASYPGNETYLPSNGTGTITVIPKIPTHTVVGNVTTYPDSDVTIPINITAEDGIPFNGNVTITFPDGSNKTVEIINGTGNTTWHVPANYTPGNYTDFAVFDGNENYFPSNGTGNIEVLPIPTHTTVGNVTTYPGRNVTIPVNVTADDGKPFNGNVTITFPDGSNQTVEIINGTGNATWTVPVNYVPGNYPDKDSYAGNDTYLPSNSTGTITVLPIPTAVSIGNITTYPGENVTIPINATVFEDEPFTGNVTVQMPDGSVQTVEIINGSGNITWFVPEDYVPDNYTDTIKFLGNETCLPSNNTGNIEVIKIPTHVTIGNVTAYPGEEVKIPINVTADNDKPFNGNVTVKLPDGTNQTVEIINGTGNITWTVPDDYTPDVYNDTIEVIGDEKYLPSNGTGHIEVVRIPTHITVGNVTTFAGRDVTIPINVAADDGKPFTGNVTITLPDGSTKTVEIINGTGTTTWFVPSDYNPDKYPDAVRFNGDVKYLPSEGKGTITVIKIPVDIVVGNVTAHPGDKVTINIEVIPHDGSLFNDDVTVELPDGTKKVVEITDNKGSVDWTIPMDYKGDYLVKVSYDETEVYYPANGTGVITVIVDEHPQNGTATPQKDMPKGTLARHETGNPILALLAVLALLGISVKRKK